MIKANTFITSLLLLTGSLLLTGAGYNGSLPDLGDAVKNRSLPDINSVSAPENPYRKDIILPLAPVTASDNYSSKIVKKGRYTEYLKDVTDFIPILESFKKVIKNRNADSLQLFSAKASLISSYVNYLNEKYDGRPEKNFESYKQILRLNRYITETNEYWLYTAKYNKYLRGSVKDVNRDNLVMNRKLNEALVSINKLLNILKTNLKD